MAKDFIDDITPAGSSGHGRRIHIDTSREDSEEDPVPVARSIRNIPVSPSRARNAFQPERPPDTHQRQRPSLVRGLLRRFWIWGAIFVVCILALIVWLVVLRPTTVTIVPHSQAVVFDRSAHFTAYPIASAPTSTLPYVIQTTDLEESTTVPTEGTVHAEEKASGLITVVNNYSTSPVTLIKNTRFRSPNGLIFRAPSEIMIPAKKGSTPGEISVTVVADQVGETYNIGPTTRFTLPGLQSNAPMYANVYAKSGNPMAGGFSGDRPGVAPGAAEAAQSSLKARLEEKARTWIASRFGEGVVFPDIVRITYATPAATVEGNNNMRIHAKAHVELIVFPAEQFAHMIAMNVSADAGQASVSIKGKNDFSARLISTPESLGTTPLDFSLTGSAELIWNVDTEALAAALAGKDKSAFEMIASGFNGIDEAHARVEPFWKSTFPGDAKAIQVKVLPPKTTP